MDKANKHKINELEIVMSELEGMLSLKDIRLEER